MKIRNGFVSNSSSSSFVVLFPKEPQNVSDVKEILFGDQKVYYAPFDNLSWTTEDVSETIWYFICYQTKNDLETAKSYINSGSIDDPNAPEYEDFDHIKDWNLRSDLYDNAREQFAKKKLKEFFNERKLKLKKINGEEIDDIVLYCFHFGDEDGTYFAALEHGDLFNNVKHIRISNH